MPEKTYGRCAHGGHKRCLQCWTNKMKHGNKLNTLDKRNHENFMMNWQLNALQQHFCELELFNLNQTIKQLRQSIECLLPLNKHNLDEFCEIGARGLFLERMNRDGSKSYKCLSKEKKHMRDYGLFCKGRIDATICIPMIRKQTLKLTDMYFVRLFTDL